MNYDGEEWRIFRKFWEAKYFENASGWGRHMSSTGFAEVVALMQVGHWVSLGFLRTDA